MRKRIKDYDDGLAVGLPATVAEDAGEVEDEDEGEEHALCADAAGRKCKGKPVTSKLLFDPLIRAMS